MTAAKLTCPCNTLRTPNSFARSDTGVVIDSESHPSRTCIKHLPYSERLQVLGLPTLEYRRERADMIQVYKILHGIDIANREKLFQMAPYTTTRGHSLKFFKKRCRLNLRSNYFSQRVIDQWNGLPINLVTAPSLNAFKSRLNNFWKDHPFKFRAACYLTEDETRQGIQLRKASKEAT